MESNHLQLCSFKWSPRSVEMGQVLGLRMECRDMRLCRVQWSPSCVEMGEIERLPVGQPDLHLRGPTWPSGSTAMGEGKWLCSYMNSDNCYSSTDATLLCTYTTWLHRFRFPPPNTDSYFVMSNYGARKRRCRMSVRLVVLVENSVQSLYLAQPRPCPNLYSITS